MAGNRPTALHCPDDGWTQVCAGAHFPSDVLAGLLLGSSVGRLASQSLLSV